MAGWPVTLQIGVKGTKLTERVKPFKGSSGVESKVPRGTGGSPRVGVSRTSKSSKNFATCLDTLWRV